VALCNDPETVQAFRPFEEICVADYRLSCLIRQVLSALQTRTIRIQRMFTGL
jgi:hypothetical protein